MKIFPKIHLYPGNDYYSTRKFTFKSFRGTVMSSFRLQGRESSHGQGFLWPQKAKVVKNSESGPAV